MPTRCQWCGDDPLYIAYHDEEWGVPVHDDRKLFEMLILEGAQADHLGSSKKIMALLDFVGYARILRSA